MPVMLGASPRRGRQEHAMTGDSPPVIRRSGPSAPVSSEKIVLGEGTDSERLAKLERVLVGLVPMIDAAIKHGGEERSALAESEAWWTCSGCKKRLGIVNNATGELRIRHDGGRFLYRIAPGAGGSVVTACNSCGAENTLRDMG